jgi:hypothetical protein
MRDENFNSADEQGQEAGTAEGKSDAKRNRPFAGLYQLTPASILPGAT